MQPPIIFCLSTILLTFSLINTATASVLTAQKTKGIEQIQSDDRSKIQPLSQLVILLYHHIDDKTPASTSTAPKLFQQHLEYLHQNNFKVMDLKQALDALFNGETLPEKAVAITFDDGYQSIYHTAWPLLKKYQFPFTVFVATEPVDKAYAQMMNWEQLQQLSNSGVTIANHSASHAHLLELTSEQVDQEILLADRALSTKLATKPTPLFAYPYGEYSMSITQLLAEKNIYGFSQISGAVSAFSNPLALPRFSFSGQYANLEQFKLKVNSLAMPVKIAEQFDPLINKPVKKFTLSLDFVPFSKHSLNCFYNNKNIEQVTWSEQTVTIQLPKEPTAGRSRINCTAPANNGQFYWHTIPIFVEPENGKWPD